MYFFVCVCNDQSDCRLRKKLRVSTGVNQIVGYFAHTNVLKIQGVTHLSHGTCSRALTFMTQVLP